MDFSEQRDKTIVLGGRGKSQQFFIETIVYIECNGYISTLYLNNGDKPETFSILLKEIEEKVCKYGFFRINRNSLINLKYFKSLVLNQKRVLLLENGRTMKISRRRLHLFREIVKL